MPKSRNNSSRRSRSGHFWNDDGWRASRRDVLDRHVPNWRGQNQAAVRREWQVQRSHWLSQEDVPGGRLLGFLPWSRLHRHPCFPHQRGHLHRRHVDHEVSNLFQIYFYFKFSLYNEARPRDLISLPLIPDGLKATGLTAWRMGESTSRTFSVNPPRPSKGR